MPGRRPRQGGLSSVLTFGPRGTSRPAWGTVRHAVAREWSFASIQRQPSLPSDGEFFGAIGKVGHGAWPMILGRTKAREVQVGDGRRRGSTMIARAILGAILWASVTGCTHHQLTRSAVL